MNSINSNHFRILNIPLYRLTIEAMGSVNKVVEEFNNSTGSSIKIKQTSLFCGILFFITQAYLIHSKSEKTRHTIDIFTAFAWRRWTQSAKGKEDDLNKLIELYQLLYSEYRLTFEDFLRNTGNNDFVKLLISKTTEEKGLIIEILFTRVIAILWTELKVDISKNLSD